MITIIRDACPLTNGVTNLPLAVENCGRLGVQGSKFIDKLAAGVVGERDGGVHGMENNGEGTPTPNRIGDYTGRHFAEGVALQAPA